MAPLHHHFELIGWSESKVIVRFWIAALVFALFALTTLKLRWSSQQLVAEWQMAMDVKGKRVLVVGLGKSGVASAQFLAARGARVTVSDTRSQNELKNEIPALRKPHKVGHPCEVETPFSECPSLMPAKFTQITEIPIT